MAKDKVKSILTLCIAVTALFYLAASLFYRPILCNDALNGMLSLHNYLHGSGWNKVLTFSADGNVKSAPLTWWAPGQYHIPYLISRIFFINEGSAISIMLFSATFSGCYLYYLLFKLSSVPTNTVLFATLILLWQRFFNIFFIQYNAPDQLLFWYVPLYILTYRNLARNIRKNWFLKMVVLVVLNVVGLYIKSSSMLFQLAFNIFLIAERLYVVRPIYQSLQTTPVARRFKIAVVVIPFVIAALLDYFFFLKNGGTPIGGSSWTVNPTTIITGIFSPIMEILFGSLSLSGMYGNIYTRISLPTSTSNALMVTAIIIIAAFTWLKRNNIIALIKTDLVFRAAASCACMYVLFWFTFSIKQSAISSEDRLFLPATILIFPYLLNWGLKGSAKLKYLYLAAVFLSAIYGMGSFFYRIKTYTTNGSVHSNNVLLNGFKVYSNNKGDEKYLRRISSFISQHYPSTEIVVISRPEIAFMLGIHNRFVVADLTPSKGGKSNYLVLVEEGKGRPPAGTVKRYSAGRFALYK